MMQYRYVARGVQQLGELEIEGVAATSDLQDDGIALVMAGGNLTRFRNGAPLLFSHDPTAIIGRISSITATVTTLTFRATFPTPGVSARADEARGLAKDGILTGVSLGFGVDKSEPLAGGGGRRATAWTGYEISLVAVPLDVGATITARALRARRGEALPVGPTPLQIALRGGDSVAIAFETRLDLERRALAASGVRLFSHDSDYGERLRRARELSRPR